MIIFQPSLPKTHNLYLLTDTHIGSILFHESGFERSVETIRQDKIGYVAFIGDIAEGILIDDYRYSHDTIDPKRLTPVRQYQDFISLVKPIAHKILVIMEGNHDALISTRYGSLLKEVVAPALNPKKNIYGTYSCKLHILDKKGQLQYKVFLTHGSRSISSTADNPLRREANTKLQLQRLLQHKAGDCYIMARGHSHKLLVKSPVRELYLTDDGTKVHHAYTRGEQTADNIHPDRRWYVSAGAFYKLYHEGISSYAERGDYDPIELGYAVVRVVDGCVQTINRVVI
ncbi:MAG: hypothetical protein QME51_08730 [Planctomycetota bacterium]|nr:hypothetical protein [Planctomycetota bacterium]